MSPTKSDQLMNQQVVFLRSFHTINNHYNFIIIYNPLLNTQMLPQDKTFLAKCPQLQMNSDQWKSIQFKLQLSLGTCSVIIKRIYDISNAHVASSFSNYAKGSIVLQSFISTDKLTSSNKLAKVCQKGYQIQEDGMIFNVGYNHVRQRSKNQLSFIMNKVSVGKSYCYPLKKFIQNPIHCPQGFQSIYLYNQQQNAQVFKHQYVTFKNHQVLPIYLIDFVIDAHKQQQIKTPYCQNCTKIPPQIAKLYCTTEQAYFCFQCDKDYHGSKLSNKHIRVQISQKPKRFGTCDKHDSQQLQLYCSVCSQALCVNCKIFGDHMTGEMAEHSLIKLKDAYSQISSKVKQIDPNIERRKNQLTQDLSKIDLKIKQVNTKATHIQEQIYAIFKKVLQQLQAQTQKKLSYLIGDQLQLKRQYDHILWMDSFIKHQLQLQQPHEFLHCWYKFSKYKKEVLSLTNLSINTQVKADMSLEGDIRIITQGNMRRKKDEKLGKYDQKQMGLSPLQSMMSPVKQNKNSQKDLGSTQLRKTVFKKHYLQKIKDMGNQPSTIKGAVPSINKGQS